MKTTSREIEIVVEASSGNVFADLGLEGAEEMSLKAQLAVQIVRAMRERGWSQQQTAESVGLKQPDVSNIVNARLSGISLERLFAILNRLGHSIEVRVTAEAVQEPHLVMSVG